MLKRFLLFVFLAPVILQVAAQTGTHQPLRLQNFTPDSVLIVQDLKGVWNWFAASVPERQPSLFTEALTPANFTSRLNCARLSWYIIDPLFYDKNTNLIPANILNNPNERSGFYVSQVWENDIFPDRIPINGVPVNLAVLNISFYPGEKGLTNFDVAPGAFSAGIEYSGQLKNPSSRWGGMMRALFHNQMNSGNDTITNAMIKFKYIDFWLMDPFVESPQNEGGRLYIDMGDISEDIQNNGILDKETNDLGYDNLDDNGERMAYQSYLDAILGVFGAVSPAYANASADPSSDKYHYFRGSDYDKQELGILARYKSYTRPEGNSTHSPQEYYPTIATTIPNTEDINRNGVFDTVEAYSQYEVDLYPHSLVEGKNHITETRTVTTTFINGITATVNWFHFQIPICLPDTIIGNFSQASSARFMRLFLKGFNLETHLRFATFGLGYMQEKNYKNRISVYPIPTQGLLTVDFDNRTPRSILLFDYAGKLVRQQDIDQGTGPLVPLDLSCLSGGIYLLKLVTDQETAVTKVIIEK